MGLAGRSFINCGLIGRARDAGTGVSGERMSLVLMFFLLLSLGVSFFVGWWVFVSVESFRVNGGCAPDLVPFLGEGFVVGCAMSGSNMVIGVDESRWLLASFERRGRLVSAARNSLKGGEAPSRVELRGNSSGFLYWGSSLGGKEWGRDFGGSWQSPLEVSVGRVLMKVLLLAVLLVCCWLFALLWVARDCSLHGVGGLSAWLFVVAFVPVLGFGAYLVGRRRHAG